MNLRRLIPVAVALLCAAAFSPAHADPAAAAPPVAAPGLTVLPPASAPKNSEQQLPAAADVDDESKRPKALAGAPGPQTPKPSPNIFQRASALMKDREGIAATLAQKDQEIARLRQELATANGTITQQNTELTDLRAGRDQLQAALNLAEAGHRTVEQTVASLGFDSRRLPAAGDLDHAAENSIEGLAEKMKAERDPVKQSAIRSQIIELQERAAKKPV